MIQANVRTTKDRILDATERLIAKQGIAATSLRQITAEAAVNLAAVNYHFQSKDDLVLAVYRRRIVPMNEERLALLDELEKTYGNKAVPLEELLRAFVEPVLSLSDRMARAGIPIGGMLGRIYTEPFEKFLQGFYGEMGAVVQRFLKAFRKAQPELSAQEAMWRLWFTIGTIAHTVGSAGMLQRLSQGACDSENKQQALRQIIAYTKAGWEAGRAK